MTAIQPEYTNGWVRIISIAIVEQWQVHDTSGYITPKSIALLESCMANKLKVLPFILYFSVLLLSYIIRVYCTVRFQSIGFQNRQKRKLLVSWLMTSDNRLVVNYRLFIEKFTILYLMEQIEKNETFGAY